MATFSDLNTPKGKPTSASAKSTKKKLLGLIVDGKKASKVTDKRLLELGIKSVDEAIKLIDSNRLKIVWNGNNDAVVAIFDPKTNKVRHSKVGNKTIPTPKFDWSDVVTSNGNYLNMENKSTTTNKVDNKNTGRVGVSSRVVNSSTTRNTNNPTYTEETYTTRHEYTYTNAHTPATITGVRNRVYDKELDAPSTKKDDNGIIRYNTDAQDPWNAKVWNGANYNLEGFLNSVGLTYDRMLSRILTLDTFNRNKLINPIDVINFGKSYVFFTKPDLYLFTDNNGTINPSIEANCPDLYVKIKRNPRVARQLQSIFSDTPVTNSSKGFINLLCNRCSAAPSVDIGLSNKEAPLNKFNLGIKYGGDFLAALKENEVSFSFFDLRDRDIHTLFEIWTEYIEGVSCGKIYTKRYYRDANILDYAISYYTILSDEVNNIVMLGGGVGAFPLNINTELLEHSNELLDAQKFLGPFAYQFQVSHFLIPNSHSIVEAFNYASGFADMQSHVDPNQSFGTSYPSSYKGVFYGGKINADNTKSKNTQSKAGQVKYIMHHSIEAWGRDIIRYSPEHESDLFKNYQHQLTITEYWPQYVGITASINSYGINQYNLIFYSSEEYLGTPLTYDDLIYYKAFDNKSSAKNKAPTGYNGILLNYIYWARYNSLGISYMNERNKDLTPYLEDPVYRDFVADGTASMLIRHGSFEGNASVGSQSGISKGKGSGGKLGGTGGSGTDANGKPISLDPSYNLSASRYDRASLSIGSENGFKLTGSTSTVNNLLNSLWK